MNSLALDIVETVDKIESTGKPMTTDYYRWYAGVLFSTTGDSDFSWNSIKKLTNRDWQDAKLCYFSETFFQGDKRG